MPADLYLFMNDRLHFSNTGASLTVSDTAPGYSMENVRVPELMTAWKGGDSTTVDKWLQVNGDSTGWLGSAGQTAFSIIAYDNRGADQDSINLNYDNADNPAMSAQTTVAVWTVSTFKTDVTMEFKSFTIPTPAKQHYRLLQPGGARTEPTGSITTKIMCWSMYNADGVIRLPIDFPGDGESDYEVRNIYRVAEAETAGGLRLTNEYARAGQRFTVGFKPGSESLYRRLQNDFFANGGRNRAIFVQKEGLRNPAQTSFFLCRLVDDWNSSRQYRDQYDATLTFETEPWL